MKKVIALIVMLMVCSSADAGCFKHKSKTKIVAAPMVVTTPSCVVPPPTVIYTAPVYVAPAPQIKVKRKFKLRGGC